MQKSQEKAPHTKPDTRSGAPQPSSEPPNPSRGARICVLGAGCSGLVATKSLLAKGLPVTCFEMGSDLGGLWVRGNSNGRPSAYASLHINTSTKEMEYSDFPMRTDIGHFPHHRHVAEYFRAYAHHFGLKKHIQFQHRVEHCRPLAVGAESKGYRVTVRDLSSGTCREEDFDALVVANGHHFSPSFPVPDPAAGFKGTVLHSSAYQSPTEPSDLRDQRVLVVGMGNSAMDIACELARSGGAAKVCVSARRGAWVLPKFLRGKPIDQGNVIPLWLPPALRRRVVSRSFEWIFGKMSDFGLPQPDHLLGEAHPTVSSDFPPLVANGDIHMRTGIASASGTTVHFSNGREDDFDTIIYCTGYKIEFPFFAEEHLAAPDNEIPLYHRAFHPQHRRVFFVGLLQTIGAVMPVAEVQAQAIAAHLSGEFNLPNENEMRRLIDEDRDAIRKRFVASKRHTMQVDPNTFHKRLHKDLIRGRKRAQRGEGIAFPQLGSS